MTFDFIKPNRKVTRVFLHCSASDYQHHDNIDTIREWHLKRGFKDIGYHYVITKDGEVHIGRPIDKIPAAQKDNNRNTIAICLTGNSAFSKEQFDSLRELCHKINDEYGKQITFHGHCEVNSYKACPNFNYKKELNLDNNGYIKNQLIGNTKLTIARFVLTIITIVIAIVNFFIKDKKI